VSLPVKEFWKSVNISGSYGQEFGVLFFWDTMYIMRNLKPTYKSLRSSAVAERPREHAVVVVVVNAQSARTVASLSSDRDQ